jgi:uncharacterized protein (UPF0335 family)
MTVTGNIGHNSGDETVAGARLKSFIERVERLQAEKDGIAADIKDLFAEIKSTGFDVKTVRKIIKLRAMDTEKRREEMELLNLYASAVQLELGL